MADYEPHPLVIEVAKKLKTSSTALENAVKALEDADKKVAGAKDPKAAAADVGTEFADLPERSDLVLYVGFLGGPVKKDWQLLWLDARLQSWLLVREADVVYYERVEETGGPEKGRDYLWVKSTAGIQRGSGPQSNEGRFLVGEFTRAGDFAASAKGGTFAAATGLLCEATTPGCCTSLRRTP
jgi:hypothetical protein